MAVAGIEAIVEFMEEEATHPRTHLMTNIYADPSETAGLHCVVLCFGPILVPFWSILVPPI